MATWDKEIEQLLEAGQRGFWVQSWDEVEVVKRISTIIKNQGSTAYVWSAMTGPLKGVRQLGEEGELITSTLLIPECAGQLSTENVWRALTHTRGRTWAVILPDAGLLAQDKRFWPLIRLWRETVEEDSGIVFFLSTPLWDPFQDLRRVVRIITADLPTRQHLAKALATSEAVPPTLVDRVADVAVGLSKREAIIQARVASSSKKKAEEVVQAVWDYKAREFDRTGLVKVMRPTETWDDLAGHYAFKKFFQSILPAFSDAGRAKNLMPRGFLFTGPYGTGKSLLTRILAAELTRGTGSQWRYLEFSIGNLLGPYVGQTEAATRELFRLVKLHAPTVLRIDEMAHQLSGFQNSGMTDAGVMAHFTGSFLKFLEEDADGVLVVGSTNEPWNLPPNLLRSGRLIPWYLDLPAEDGLEEAFTIHLRKYGAATENLKVPETVLQSVWEKRFSPAEVEQIVIEAAQINRDLVPSVEGIIGASRRIIPVAQTMIEQYKQLEAWKPRARLA